MIGGGVGKAGPTKLASTILPPPSLRIRLETPELVVQAVPFVRENKSARIQRGRQGGRMAFFLPEVTSEMHLRGQCHLQHVGRCAFLAEADRHGREREEQARPGPAMHESEGASPTWSQNGRRGTEARRDGGPICTPRSKALVHARNTTLRGVYSSNTLRQDRMVPKRANACPFMYGYHRCAWMPRSPFLSFPIPPPVFPETSLRFSEWPP